MTVRSRVVGGGPGKKAGTIQRRLLPDTEVIGPPECAILHRWTLVTFRGRKVMLHRFLPNADDRAEHDHPASFVTIVLRGHYDDITSCDSCAGRGGFESHNLDAHRVHCEHCGGSGRSRVERMHAGVVRFRAAEHRHVTKVGTRGCWTLVIFGPKRRPWGFWKDGHWYFWRDHERLFGFGMRCPEDSRDA